MNSCVTLLLSAALTAGSVAAASAAPLAKLHAGRTLRYGDSPARMPSLSDVRSDMSVGFSRRVAAGNVEGIKDVPSVSKLRNRNALKSATAASRRAIAQTIDLRGTVVGGMEAGLYSLPKTSDGEFGKIATFFTQYGYGAIDNGEGRFYGVEYMSFGGIDFFSLHTFDTETWQQISTNNLVSYDIASTAAGLDPTTGEVYGCYHQVTSSSMKYVWAKADYEVGTSTSIAELPCDLIGVGADKNGQYYGIGSNKKFYKIDKLTGAMEAISDVDIPYDDYLVGGCVNDDNATFIQSYYTSADGGGLVEIDLATGEKVGTIAFSTPAEVVGLYIPKPLAAEKAPASPEISVACENGAMEVSVTLTMPEVLFDGTPATGQTFSYSVKVDDKELLTGTAGAGEQVTRVTTMEVSGPTKFVATVANDEGRSPKVSASCYVGKGTPTPPTNLSLSWADATATLTWDAVTVSSDGGFIDPAGVTYTILDNQGNELATQSATVYTAPLAAPEGSVIQVAYKVKANYGGKSSAAVASNNVVLGHLLPPVSFDMSKQQNFDLHTVLDVNDDGDTWVYSSGSTKYRYSLKRGDDWLISPSIKTEAGKAYKFVAKVAAHRPNYPERIEIFMGEAPVAEAMATEIIPATLVKSTDGVELSAFVSFPTSALRNVGFHAISDMDMFYLYLQSYEFTEVSADLPRTVTDVKVEPDADGLLKAAISFTMPTQTVTGSDIAGNVRVKVYRDDELVAQPVSTPGHTVNIEDPDVPSRDVYTYRFVSVNAAGEEGESTSVSVLVGPKVPADVNDETISIEEPTPGTYIMSWDPVTAATDGTPLNAANVTYKVYATQNRDGRVIIGEELATLAGSTTTYEHVTSPIEQQQYYYLAVEAYNCDVPSDNATLGFIFTGTPYKMPVRYSGRDAADIYYMGKDGKGKVIWGDAASFGIDARDGDDSFIVLQNPEQYNASTSLYTGKVAIEGENPVISFYIYPNAGDDTNETKVTAIIGYDETELATFVSSDYIPGQWNKVSVPLGQYAGRDVKFKITGITLAYANCIYDNIRICNQHDYDMSVSLAAPSIVRVGEAFDVVAMVANDGLKDVGACTVRLLRDGELVDSRVLDEGIASDGFNRVAFSQAITLHDGDAADFRAVLAYEAGGQPVENESETLTVNREISTLPVVRGLNGEKTMEGNLVSWAPVVIPPPAPEMIMEDFENAESWAHGYDGWRFVDVDKSPLGGFQGKTVPGIKPGETTASFFVFDSSQDPFNNMSFEAFSGHKYLASLYRMDDATVDDWAISPRLSGEEQSVSFYARSYMEQHMEKIEVWYSTTDNDVESFVQLEDFGTESVPGEWTGYTADLPEGTTYFAIRTCATGAFMLLVDDVTFISLDIFDGELQGYNVYCDGVKLNDAPVAEASYLHVPADDVAHTYHVTAVYDKGESELSEPVTIDQSGIGAVLAAGLKVAVEGRSIVVSGAGDSLVTINAVDGKTLHAAKGDARVAVAPAVYLVTVDRKTVKVIVR